MTRSEDQPAVLEDVASAETEFAAGLRKALDVGKISQLELSQRLSVSQTTVSRWLAGRMFPKRSLLPKLQKALPQDFAWIIQTVPTVTRRRPAAQREVVLQMIDMLTLEQARSILSSILLGSTPPKNSPSEKVLASVFG